jgi:glycosyltransferase involved in cell wall biosynthesis
LVQTDWIINRIAYFLKKGLGLMKILFVIDHLGSGGAQRQMVTLAVELKKRGHTVEFFIYYPTHNHFRSELDSIEIKIHESIKYSRYSFSVIRSLHRIMQIGNYDLVLSFLGTPNFYCELAKLRRLNVPIVISIRNTYPFGRITLWRSVKEQFHRVATHITVNSHHQRVLMEHRYPWIRSKISTIYNSVDMSRFQPTEFVKKGNNIELLALGTTRHLKNMNGIAQALNICIKKYGISPTIRWAGKESHAKIDKRSHSETKGYIIRHGLDKHWEWLGERADVSQLLARHHGLILGSFYEGLPNAICEALASGRPVLASDVGDHSLLVQEGKTGFLFNPYNSEKIAAKIHAFSKLSEEEWQIMSKNARKYAQEYLSTDVGVTAYENLFSSLIDNKIK